MGDSLSQWGALPQHGQMAGRVFEFTDQLLAALVFRYRKRKLSVITIMVEQNEKEIIAL
jgi:hypothetical protein